MGPPLKEAVKAMQTRVSSTGRLASVLVVLCFAWGHAAAPKATKPTKPARPAAATARVAVSSVPTGAGVYLDGKKSCTAPCSVTLAPGTWTLTARLEGYQPAVKTLELKKGSRLEQTFTLEPLTLSVAIDSLPPGAEVYIDGNLRGRAPLMVALPPGPHRLYATKEGFAPDDEVRTLAAGTSTWLALLAPLNPPDAPPLVQAPASPVGVDTGSPARPADGGIELAASVAVPDAGRPAMPAAATVDFADLAVDVGVKRRALQQLQGQALTTALQSVKPLTDRAELCNEARDRVPPALLQVRSVELEEAPVTAEVRLDGRPLGRTPLDELVPTCVQEVDVVRDGEHRRTPLALQPNEKKQVRVDWGGTPELWSLSAFGDLTYFDPPTTLVPVGNAPAQLVYGGGLRLDKWGSLFHGSVAIHANQLYGPLVGWPVLPTIDLFAGINFHPGNRSVRAVISFQVGLWQVTQPAGRATLGMIIIDRILLTVSADVRTMLFKQIPALELIKAAYKDVFPSLFVFGASAALGVCW
jgi:hypothetical protein